MTDKNIAQAGPGSGGLPPMPEVFELAPVKAPIDYKRIGFIALGVLVFAIFYLAGELPQATDPLGKVFRLSREGQMSIGLFLMAGIWWVFEVLPIGVTAIMIGVMQALFMIRKPDDALRDFFDPSVWFIFGSLVLGMAFTRSGLTKRMAYKMLTLVGENTRFILLGCFIAVALMTLLMAHTAVAAAMIPLLMAVHNLYTDGEEKVTKFGKALFIGMAYVAGAGSVITFLGAARGVAAAGMYKTFTGNDIGFFELTWYMWPVGISMVFMIWLLMTTAFKPEKPRIVGLREKVAVLSKEQGGMNWKEKFVLTCAGLVVLMFALKSFVPALKDLDRAAIMLIPTMLFYLTGVLKVEDLEDMPWNIALLFGGAMSIGFCLWQTGAAEWLAVHWLTFFKESHWLVFVLSIAFFVLIMTNFIMNVAAIAISLPVSLVVAKYMGVSPEVVMYASLITAGMPFNLLIGAAPNAMAYESKQFTTGEFFIWGWPANIILMIILAVAITVIWPLFGMPILVK
ncbi:MAG: SLC13/DASS family transporter [Desulfarculus sp.]|nr:SLC13/DASS family transporter [Desulfarculus sp.]